MILLIRRDPAGRTGNEPIVPASAAAGAPAQT